VKCPRCGGENRVGVRFCEECGTRLTLACAKCGADVPPEKRYCGACGASIAAPATTRYRSPQEYLPRHLVEKIHLSRDLLQGERKRVTVLFADLKGSMELLSGRDPDEARRLLDGLLQCMMDAVHQYEGTVNQVQGDGIMAMFGAPVAHEDHAIRACYAALTMHDLVERYSEETRAAHRRDLRIRVGLNSGEVAVRAIDSDLHLDYTGVGETTHLAARMEQLATPGTTQITSDTLRLVSGFVRAKPLGPMAVKGLKEPVEAFQLVGAEPVRSRFEALKARGLTTFVGRQHEFDVLRAALPQARPGQLKLVGVIGEAGVGKSRLLHELALAARSQGCLVLVGGAMPYWRTTSYRPVIELLRDYFKVDAQEESAAVAAKVLTAMTSLPNAQAPVLALLGALPEGSPFASLDPAQRRRQTLLAVKRLLLRHSVDQPLVLILEDLHWADSETLAVLETLVDSPPSPVLILVSYRPEFQHSWVNNPCYSQISIDPLEPASASALLDGLLGTAAELDPVKRLLIERTEGNPFFLEESSRTLIETRALVGAPAAYRPARSLSAIDVPDSVQAVLAARIDRLPAEEKRLLQLAAVIGRDIPFPILEALSGLSEEALRGALGNLQAAGFLYEARLFPELEYTFKHSLTQEVAYAGLIDERRQTHHAEVGNSLEAMFEGRTGEVVEALAHHFGKSRESEKAVDYAILAAGKAQSRWANADAVAHFGAALQRLGDMPDTPANRVRRIDAVLKQAEVKFTLGQLSEHARALEGIAHLVHETDDPLRRAAWFYWTGFLETLIGGRLESAIRHCLEAVAIAEAEGAAEVKAYAESCLTQAYVFTGELRKALEVGERALDTFESLGNLWWACRTVAHLSPTANALAEWDRSLRYCKLALEHGVALNDVRLKVAALFRTASAYIQRGDPARGLKYCEDALALSPGPFDMAAVKAVRGHGLARAGRGAEGVVDLEEALGWFGRSSMRYTRTQVSLWLAEGRLVEGHLEQARAVAEEALATSRELGYRHLEGVALRLLTEALGPGDPAWADLRATAARILDEIGVRFEPVRAAAAAQRREGPMGDQIVA
jgi:class 3 adenylate cyclase/tetratricopeptide (TPR) repeat protein